MAVFRKVLKDSCEVSSMKALPRIVRSTSIFQLIIWSTGLICGLVLGGYQVAMLLIQYLNYPTSVDIIEINGSPPFPAVTICHQDPEWTARKLELHFGESFSQKKHKDRILEMMKSYDINSQEYNTTKYLKDSFGGYLQNMNLVGYNIDILLNHLLVDCSKYLFEDSELKTCSSRQSQKVFLDPVFGMCVTIEDHNTTELNVILYLGVLDHEVLKDFNAADEVHLSGVGARVIIHPHGSYPDINYFSHHVLPGREYDFDIKGREWIYLGEPYGQCVKPSAAQNEGKPGYDIYRHGYECYRMCSKHEILEQCGCLHVYYNHGKNATLCGEIGNNITQMVSRMYCARSVMTELETVLMEKCHCPKPCQEFEYDYKVEHMPWPHSIYHLSLYKKYLQGSHFGDNFQIYNALLDEAEQNETATLEKLSNIDIIPRSIARVRVLNHQWKYLRYKETPMLSIESIIGSIGGLCNIWAGISFFTLLEIVELVYKWLTQRNEHLPKKLSQHEGNNVF